MSFFFFLIKSLNYKSFKLSLLIKNKSNFNFLNAFYFLINKRSKLNVENKYILMGAV